MSVHIGSDGGRDGEEVGDCEGNEVGTGVGARVGGTEHNPQVSGQSSWNITTRHIPVTIPSVHSLVPS